MDHFFQDGIYINLDAIMAMKRIDEEIHAPRPTRWEVILVGYAAPTLIVDAETGDKLINLLAKRADRANTRGF